jgi:2-dehydro-3-deoxygluconokinase
MEDLIIRPKEECRWDEISLGEVMIRLDPGETRIKTTRNFTVWEGGGEYNVARGLKRCFKLNTGVVTGIVENDIGYLLQDLIYQGGVDQRYVKWFPFDGVGKKCRVGLNFTEKGFGVRGALGVSDRGHTAASLLKKGDIDWDQIFGKDATRWLHTGGIFAALSDTTPDVVIEALKVAKKYKVITSYDLNYRASLWKDIGGQARAQEVNKEIAQYVDVMIGNEEDFHAALGFEIPGTDENFGSLQIDSYKQMIKNVVSAYPNFKAVATTLRQAKTATINDWGAILYYNEAFYEAINRPDLEIYDRVGGGDSFASGLIYGFLADKDPQEIVNYGAAHGALAMTTPGDTTMASLKEVESLMKGSGARVQR